MKQKWLYYVLNCTWGILMTLTGALVTLVLLCIGKRPKRWGGCWYFNIGKHWGGLELGLCFLTDESDAVSVKNHEFGHSIQNCYWGVLMPFVISIPSAIRYWYREIRTLTGHKPTTLYDDIWFEHSATTLGNQNIQYWRSTK